MLQTQHNRLVIIFERLGSIKTSQDLMMARKYDGAGKGRNDNIGNGMSGTQPMSFAFRLCLSDRGITRSQVQLLTFALTGTEGNYLVSCLSITASLSRVLLGR